MNSFEESIFKAHDRLLGFLVYEVRLRSSPVRIEGIVKIIRILARPLFCE